MVIPAYRQPPTDVDVVISFGARNGGFELAWDIRNRILQYTYGIHLTDAWETPVYLDALSLRYDPGTTYDWNPVLGIYQMLNPAWEAFYRQAMAQCKYMIFIITPEWCESRWCWMEYDLYISLFRNRIEPIFVVFPGVTYNMAPNLVLATQLDNDITANVNHVIQIPYHHEIPPVLSDGIVYNYHYTLDNLDTMRILSLLEI